MAEKKPHPSNGHKTAQEIVKPICYLIGVIVVCALAYMIYSHAKTSDETRATIASSTTEIFNKGAAIALDKLRLPA